MRSKSLQRINGAPMADAAKLMTMARYIARKRVKEHLQARGIKPQVIEPSEINKAADAYLQVRGAELIAEAKLPW
jgi:hypothetical protein